MGLKRRLVIKNGQVLLPSEQVQCADVLVEDGKIARVGASLAAGREIDVSGRCVVPGLIDLHTHGIRTVNLQHGTLQEYASIEASCGTTTSCPTLFDTLRPLPSRAERR